METNFLFTAVEMVGMVAFALYGALVGLKYRLDLFGILLMGITASLGGGVIRDLFVMRMPVVLRKHVYALPVIIGAALYLLCYRLGAPQLVTSGAVIFTVFALRMLATYYHWNLPHAP